MKLRLLFGKTVWMQFTSHLDTQRALERTIRRANLPLAYSEGFTPHAKIQIAAALPLGYTSIGELVDIWLTEARNPEECLEPLNRCAPPGLVFYQAWNVPMNEVGLQSQVQSAEYRCFLRTTQSRLKQRIEALLACQSLLRQRRGRDYDLRPLIEDLGVEEAENNFPGHDQLSATEGQTNHQNIWMRLKAREGASGRPDEVLDALAIPLHEANIQRVRIILRD